MHSRQDVTRLMQDDRPEVAQMRAIRETWFLDNQAAIAAATKASKSKNEKKRADGARQLHQLHGTLYTSLVEYINRYVMAIQYEGKAMIVEEIVKMDRNTKQFRYDHIIRTVAEWEKVHLNWVLQGAGREASITSIWLKHEKRREVDNIIFRPVPEDHVETGRYRDFNMYKGAGVTRKQAEAYAATHPNWREEVKPLIDHIIKIWCKNDEIKYEYTLSWLAHVAQKPFKKTGAGLVVQGKEGGGKSVVFDKLGRVVGTEHYFLVHDPEDVLGKYTHMLKACILLFMDEALWGGDKANAEGLKKLLTQPKHSVHEKYLSSMLVDSYVNMGFATNNEHAIPAGKEARRFACLDIDNRYCGIATDVTRAYFEPIWAVSDEAFAHYLYTRDISNFDPSKVFNSELLRDQKHAFVQPSAEVVEHPAGEWSHRVCRVVVEALPRRRRDGQPEADTYQAMQGVGPVEAVSLQGPCVLVVQAESAGQVCG